MEKIKLMPGNEGKDCPGNGTVPGIECQCDECDYLMCCVPEYSRGGCEDCNIAYCPRLTERGKISRLIY